MSTLLAVVGKSTDKMHGAFLANGDSDVHVYDQSDSIVIGWNTNIHDMKFTPFALVFSKAKDQPSVHMQLQGLKDKDNPEIFALTERKLDLLSDALKQFLLRAEQIARHGV